jgi:hypothetical protein
MYVKLPAADDMAALPSFPSCHSRNPKVRKINYNVINAQSVYCFLLPQHEFQIYACDQGFQEEVSVLATTPSYVTLCI